MTTAASARTAPGIELDGGRAVVIVVAGERVLSVPASVPGFDGPEIDFDHCTVRHVSLTASAAARIREVVPALRPRAFGTERSTFGFGDRIGLATPGHVRALRAAGASTGPILAQQSARELERTGRTFRDVLDAATWGVLETGWTAGYGADGDHLRTEADISDAIAAGFSMLTLDASTSIDSSAAGTQGASLDRLVTRIPWSELEDTWPSLRRRFSGCSVDELELGRTAAMFGHALARIVALWRYADERRSSVCDVEIAVDESDVPTSVFAHRFVAGELVRSGVPFTALAPRFTGVWQKGVAVAVDPGELTRAIHAHAEIAADGGHKLSVHSGSDKFALYPLIAAAPQCRWHVKTSGTSYLEALRIVAFHDTRLFREVLLCAQEALPDDRSSYAIAATATVPDPEQIDDADLPAVLDDPDTRQCLHVTFGSVLADPSIAVRMREVLRTHADHHSSLLGEHFRRHLDPLRGLR